MVVAEQAGLQLLAQFCSIQAEAAPVHCPCDAQEAHAACVSVPQFCAVLPAAGAKMTLSTMCTTPFEPITSAVTTWASFTYTPPLRLTMVTSSPLRVFTTCESFRSPALMLPEITWYWSTLCSLCLFSGFSSESRSAFGSAANAAFVGAKTVNGPAPESVPARSAAVTAVTSVARLGVATASWTMFCAVLPAVVVAEQAGLQLLAQFCSIQAEAAPVHSPREAQAVHVACESVPEHSAVAAGRGAAVTTV